MRRVYMLAIAAALAGMIPALRELLLNGGRETCFWEPSIWIARIESALLVISAMLLLRMYFRLARRLPVP